MKKRSVKGGTRGVARILKKGGGGGGGGGANNHGYITTIMLKVLQ